MGQSLRLAARETGLNIGDLACDAIFVQLGIDSFMLLDLSEKVCNELSVKVKSLPSLECAIIGDMKA